NDPTYPTRLGGCRPQTPIPPGVSSSMSARRRSSAEHHSRSARTPRIPNLTPSFQVSTNPRPPMKTYEIKFRLKSRSNLPMQRIVIRATDMGAARSIFQQQNQDAVIIGAPKEIKQG